ncbi:Uncharacterised protein [Cytobacillus firmus]|nr:Uncharacterised protein [Cytobacillus firmus]
MTSPAVAHAAIIPRADWAPSAKQLMSFEKVILVCFLKKDTIIVDAIAQIARKN